jgi:hypothetical protein
MGFPYQLLELFHNQLDVLDIAQSPRFVGKRNVRELFEQHEFLDWHIPKPTSQVAQ